MKTCSAFLVSLELQASSFFRLVHEACSVENATVVEIMGDSWKIANRCRRNHKIRTTCPTDVGFVANWLVTANLWVLILMLFSGVSPMVGQLDTFCRLWSRQSWRHGLSRQATSCAWVDNMVWLQWWSNSETNHYNMVLSGYFEKNHSIIFISIMGR